MSEKSDQERARAELEASRLRSQKTAADMTARIQKEEAARQKEAADKAKAAEEAKKDK